MSIMASGRKLCWVRPLDKEASIAPYALYLMEVMTAQLAWDDSGSVLYETEPGRGK